MNEKSEDQGITRRDFLEWMGTGVTATLFMMAENPLFAQPAPGKEASLPRDIASQPQGDLERFLAAQEPYFRDFAKNTPP